MDRDYLESQSVVSLRSLARQHTDLAGTAIVSMRKEALIAALLGETDPEPPVMPGNGNGTSGTNDDLADVLARALNGKISAGIDEERVREIIAETGVDKERLNAAIEEKIRELNLVRPVEVKRLNGTTEKVGKQHFMFEKILNLLSLGENIMLVGPSGSGKTYCCEAVAKALDLPFYMIPVGLQTTKSDLMGYMDATGNYVPSLLRRAYEHGGVLLVDEIDAGNPNVMTCLNALLENGFCGFPDGMVKRHENFVCIAAGNTFGRGANQEYVGRNPMDGASRERFAFVPFDYDERLEMDLAINKDWTRKVQKIRRTVEELRERLIVSPRASIKGSRALAAGFTEDECLDMYVFKGITQEVKSRIMASYGEDVDR